MSQEISLVVENFDAVRSVVANEDLLSVVDDDTIRKLQVFGAAKLVENISHLIEDDNTHHLQHYNVLQERNGHTQILDLYLDIAKLAEEKL